MKYYITFCTMIKDEDIYLEEWIKYHLNLGVDKFIIYDNLSTTPVEETLKHYIINDIVSVIKCDINYIPQLKTFNHCLYTMCNETTWLGFIDVDEFIILNKHDNIKEFLACYEKYPGVCLNWKVYSANNHKSNPGGSVMENFLEAVSLDEEINTHVKTILQPKYANCMHSPHAANYYVDMYAVNEKGVEMQGNFSAFSNEVAHINHYFTKSYEEWVDKLKKGRPDADIQRKEYLFWKYNPGMISLKDELQRLHFNDIKKFTNNKKIQNDNAWEILLTGEIVKEVKKVLESISKSLLNSVTLCPDFGLLEGQMGAAIFFFNYYRLSNNEDHEDSANDLISNIANTVYTPIYSSIDSKNRDLSFKSGLAGISWAIQYLTEENFIDCDVDDILHQADIDFQSKSIFNLLNYSLNEGMIGIGMYNISRIYNSYNSNKEYDYEYLVLENIVTYLNLFLPEADASDQKYNLSSSEKTVSNGLLAIIPFLLKLIYIGIDRERILSIVDKCVAIFQDSIESQPVKKLNWDSGNLAIANCFLRVALETNNEILKTQALNIALDAIPKNDFFTNNRSIDNFSAVHIFNHFYQESKINDFKIAAKNIVEYEIKNIYSYDLNSENMLSPDYCGLNGMSGIGLILMACINGVRPKWDSCLLLS